VFLVCEHCLKLNAGHSWEHNGHSGGETAADGAEVSDNSNYSYTMVKNSDINIPLAAYLNFVIFHLAYDICYLS